MLIPVHHSIEDWDFQQGATNRSLSATQYVSAPTSLRILQPTSADFHDAILCRHPDTLCLPQGQVINWVYSYYYSQVVANFRNQVALGTANYSNCYEVAVLQTTVDLIRFVGGVFSRRDRTTGQGFQNSWHQYRVFWYNGKTPAEVPALCVDVYLNIAAEWVKQGATMYDTANMWKDSAINRTGFRAFSGYNHPQYWDNTEIWGPV